MITTEKYGIFNKYDVKSLSSEIFINQEKNLILKKPTKFLEYDILKREIYILELLNKLNLPWCPKLIFYNNEYFITEYCGDQITSKNIPDDYLKQINQILLDLKNLNIQHNDIYKKNQYGEENCEILVKNEKLFLVDFGWCSINKKFNCLINLDNKKKPCGIFDDSKVINYLNKLFEMKNRLSVSNRRNNQGSQIEKPNIIINQQNLEISGYHQFTINNNEIILKSKIYKYNKIKEILLNLINHNNINSISDVGCSAGIVSYLSYFLKVPIIYALDHDNEYLEIIRKINNKLEIKNVFPIKYSFGDMMNQSDIIIMLALIHWIYSCTSLYGNFDDIFKYLKPFIKQFLLIEWIEPNDNAIKKFKHLSFNSDIIKEEYNKENFEKSLLKNIGKFESIIELDGKTRILYIVRVN